jgi:GT2 family glycosyltransferase
MYYEDFDLCCRAQQAGYQNLYLPKAVITHHGGHSVAAGTVRLNGMIGQYALAAQYHYIRKHSGTLAMWALRLLYGLADLAIWSVGLLQLNPDKRTQGVNYGRLLALTPVPCHSTTPRRSR